jgi:hypothetical protein
MGVVDGLFTFSRPVTGGYYWCPPLDLYRGGCFAGHSWELGTSERSGVSWPRVMKGAQ